MNRIIDILRMVTVSPEIMIGCFIWGCYCWYPQIFMDFLPIFSSDDQWKLPALVAVPIALLAAAYNIGSDILSPQGKRVVILDWPDYWRLKIRVIWCLTICLISVVATIIGYYIIHKFNHVNGFVIIIISWSISATALMTGAYAKWSVREIFRE